MSAWWRHFPQRTRAIRDELFVLTLHTSRAEGGKLVGVLPFMRTERSANGLLQVRSLTFLGADPNITELRQPLIDPAYEVDVAHAALAFLERSPDWDWVQWPGMRQGSLFAATVERRVDLRWEDRLPVYVVPLARSWEAFRAGLKRNVKESLRHCYNSLTRDGHSMRLTVARTPEEIAAGLPLFFDLHARRANLEGAVTHPHRFASATSRAFLEDVCDKLAHAGLARLYVLHVNGSPVACRLGFACGQTLYLYYSGYDPQWAKYSVMTTTVAEAIKLAIEEGFQFVHLSTGTDVSKTRWGPREVLLQDAIQNRSGIRPRLARDAFVLLREARREDRLTAISRLLPQRMLQ